MNTTPTNNRDKIQQLSNAGVSYSKIARRLGISVWTVKYHLCPSRAEDKRLQYSREWRKKNPLYGKVKYFLYRDKTLAERYSVKDVYDKLSKNPVCYLTGTKVDLSNGSSYHLDHIVPLSRGGTSDLSNLGLCSPAVNKAKHNLSPTEFVDLCIKVVTHAGYSVGK